MDHRFWEVLIAEAMAFMGNRSLRWWARHLVDWTSEFWIFPLFVVLVDEEWEYAGMVWKIVILVMGLLRGILPFMFSFVGSRIGRSTALAASELRGELPDCSNSDQTEFWSPTWPPKKTCRPVCCLSGSPSASSDICPKQSSTMDPKGGHLTGNPGLVARNT